MTILTSEIKARRSATNDDTSSNGGRMTASEIVSGTGSLWPFAGDAERTAGSDKYRLVHWHIADSEDGTLSGAKCWLKAPTDGDDAIYLSLASAFDETQGDLSSPDFVGAGTLDADASAGATSIDVLVEDGTITIFRDTEEIYLDDGTNSEFIAIDGTPTLASSVWTIPLAAGGLANSYLSATPTTVSSVIAAGDVACEVVGTPTVTSTSGTFDKTDVTLSNIGTEYDTITFTFTSATAFTCAGAALGSLGSGNIGSTFAPSNPDFGGVYFSVASAAWGGTFVAADTVEMVVAPAAIPVWERRKIPAGAGTSAANTRTVCIYGA